MNTTAPPAARRHRSVAAALALLTLLGSTTLTGTARAATASSGPLASPTSDDAMLNMLMGNGIGYTTETTADDAAQNSGADSTLVIDSDETNMSAADISTLAHSRWGRVIILGTASNLLAAFAPGVTPQSNVTAADASTPVSPQCDQADAAAAGTVLMPTGTEVYQLPAEAGASPTPTAGPGATPTATSVAQDVTGC